MMLSPVKRRETPSIKRKSVTWNENQLAVTRLITETNALIDIFDELAINLGPEIELSLSREPKLSTVEIPSAQFDSILENSCQELEKCLNACESND